MDDDKNRKLSVEEFQKGVSEYGLNFSKAEVGELFRAIDVDQNGSIDFDEFLRRLRVCFIVLKKLNRMSFIDFSIDILASNE
jgi:Ca2+-binding EF-hand superfamily protein